MKYLYIMLVGACFIIGSTQKVYAQDVELYQMVLQSKEQIKWDCAKLIYLLVKNAISKVTHRPLYTTLYQQIHWVFDSSPMHEVADLTHLLASRSEMYALAASIARQNQDEDAVLVLQIASEYARKGWLASHAYALLYSFGVACGYAVAYYVPFNKDLLKYIPVA